MKDKDTKLLEEAYNKIYEAIIPGDEFIARLGDSVNVSFAIRFGNDEYQDDYIMSDAIKSRKQEIKKIIDSIPWAYDLEFDVDGGYEDQTLMVNFEVDKKGRSNEQIAIDLEKPFGKPADNDDIWEIEVDNEDFVWA